MGSGICYRTQYCVLGEDQRKRSSIIHFSTRKENILDYYELSEIIGLGSHGVVRKAHLRNSPNIQVAVKSIEKSKLGSPSNLNSMKREIEALLSVDHPNIMKLHESFEDDRYFHIVTEYLPIDDFLQYLSHKRLLSETELADYFLHMFRAVQHMHFLKICHRDIKPENFMMAADESAAVKLIDFGSSIGFSKKQRNLGTNSGSAFYAAPEVKQGLPYTFKSDIWSLGVILYITLAGKMPANDNWDLSNLQNASPEVMNLMENLLQANPDQRYSAIDAINHSWFSKCSSKTSNAINQNTANILRQIERPNKFHIEAQEMVVKLLSHKELKRLQAIFEEIDTDHNGFLTLSEMNQTLGKFVKDPSNIMRLLDRNGDGKINYSEFLAATHIYMVQIDEDTILNAFRRIDKDNSGFITPGELASALNSQGKRVRQPDVASMIKEVDLGEKDGVISYQEFKAMFKWSY